jgi:hypothetical protein
MRSRPRSTFVKKLKAMRCPKCGTKIAGRLVRCKRCSRVINTRPKK